MAEYPKNRRCKGIWANHVVRMMNKSCAANEIGPEGFTLVATIAMTEDAKRYSGAVTFYNGQLMPITGLRSEARLNSARRKSIDSGWLHYEPGTKSVPGRYWTLIPEHAGRFNDAPVDDGDGFPSECPSDFEGQTKRTDRESNENSESKLRTYKPSPDTSPLPNSGEGEAWNSVRRNLERCGITHPDAAIRNARKSGWSAAHVRAVVAHFDSKPAAWEPFQLFTRFKLPAEIPATEGWPPESAEYGARKRTSHLEAETKRERERRERKKQKVEAERNGGVQPTFKKQIEAVAERSVRSAS